MVQKSAFSPCNVYRPTLSIMVSITVESEIGYDFDTVFGGWEPHNIIELVILGPGRIVLKRIYNLKPVPTVNAAILRVRRVLVLDQALICVAFKRFPKDRLRVECLLGLG